MLSDNYQDFLKVALENHDLKLFSAKATASLSEDQQERQLIIYSMLVSLFERAYVLLYQDSMTPTQARRWNSWDDYIREWCRKSDFRNCLPKLMRGEDPEFVSYLQALVTTEAVEFTGELN